MASKLSFNSPLTLKDLQIYVAAMEQERGFTGDAVTAKCLLLAEEVGELLKCVRKSHSTLGTDAHKKYDYDPAGELADIIIVLTTIANRLGIDLEQALCAKEEANKQRSWR